jgi:Protein of unknown function (DUF998)
MPATGSVRRAGRLSTRLSPLLRRGAAAAAGLAVLTGAVVMLVALVSVPGPWLRGYVSEAGTAGQPLPGTYRAGLLVLALGAALLGLALLPRSRLAASLLVVASLFAATSGAVPCTNRCPLPPYEPTTVTDVVHASASIVGLVLIAGAMLAVALARLRPAARRLAACALAGIVPLGGWLGLIMLFSGRGPFGALLERLILAVAVCWLIGTSVVTLLTPEWPPSDRVQAWPNRPGLTSPSWRARRSR